MIREAIERVSGDRLRRDLFYLSSDPLKYRKVNYTRPGQSKCSLAEADDYIRGQLQAAGYDVETTDYRIQAWRCDKTKTPKSSWFATPEPSDPWYDAANLEATRRGRERPDEFVQMIAHKDSMSWIDSPAAHDNCTGTVANLEVARIVAGCDLKRSVRFLFCNEEHWPWTSRFAADAAAKRGDQIIAALNQDLIDAKPDADMLAGRMMHGIAWSTDEGKLLADFIQSCAPRHGIQLEVKSHFKEHVNDDDGMYIKAGFRTTVMNSGGGRYTEYHLPGDIPERVNLENLVRSTQLLLAAVLELAEGGADVLRKA